MLEVIAEVGSNIKSHDDCIRSIGAAKAAGADAVKFQSFTGAELYGPTYAGNRSLFVDAASLAQECEMTGIEFLCTTFSPAGYDSINPFVKRHKIASSEITAIDILDKVNSFRKPVILSTGGANHTQIQIALDHLDQCPVTILFCVVDYPAKIIDFRELIGLRRAFGNVARIGYSDHSVDVLNIPMLAKQHEISLIEKHVNFCGYTDTPDACCSISGYELSLMIRHLRGETSVGETFIANRHQRILTPHGYFRPQ